MDKKENNEKEYDLRCPYCGCVGDYCDFPDLFYDDADNTPELNEQVILQEEMWDVGFNIVTCGNCGQVFIHRTN